MKPPGLTDVHGATGGRNAGAGTTDGIAVEALRAQLEKVLASSSFAHAERLSRFLRFTVEQALEGRQEHLKEYLLGVEVFDRDETYDTRTDPIVRVEAGRLRARLERYYKTEGYDDPILIHLPKGSYVPTFQQRSLAVSIGGGRLLQWNRERLPWLAACLFALLAAGVLLRNYALQRQLDLVREGGPPAGALSLWKPFFRSGVETIAVFGSPLFLAGGADSGLFIRQGNLNDALTMSANPVVQDLQKRFGPLTGPRYDYALMGDAIALQRLTAFFGLAGAKLIAVPAHQASWESIRGGNIILLGAPRTHSLLRSYPGKREFEWDAGYNVINRNPQPGEPPVYATRSHYDEMTYAVIAFLPGLRADRAALLVSTHSAPGIKAAVDYVTQPPGVQDLTTRLGLERAADPKHFELLIRVYADKGEPVKAEYVAHHLVPAGRASRP